MLFAKIITNLSIDKVYEYKIPEELEGAIKIGSQVVISFRHSEREGFVIAISGRPDYPIEKLKFLKGINENKPSLPKSLVELGQWMAMYYCCSQEQAIRTLLPGAVRNGRIKPKTVSYYFIEDKDACNAYLEKNGKRSKKQAAILHVLLEEENGLLEEELLAAANATKVTLNRLIKEKIVVIRKEEIVSDPYSDTEILRQEPKTPSEEQKKAIDTIREMMDSPDGNHTALLFGITGSGKTEVYLQVIAYALEKNKEAIVLVPEISLTPQTVRRFIARFGNEVSVMHSGLSNQERFDEWNRINNGDVKIVVGARSALFAPFRNLGLIIVDEEHESSYKQSEAPRYNARDVAVMRGLKENAVVVLGSATPSYESYKNALEGRYTMLKMERRVENIQLPSMRVVDLKQDAATSESGKLSWFSRDLVQTTWSCISRGEQVILFLNKRGFARQMICDLCGYVAECSECSISYTYHKKREVLVCHLCGAVIPAPVKCPSCSSEEIRFTGVGTEKIERMAQKVFKGARIARMDSDTMRQRDEYEDVLTRMKSGRIDILIGTQMIAKGLHFPKVTLVGIINADQSLSIPDFRSGERTFQLLTQVAGRAGRSDLKGEVIVQAFAPKNETIQYAIRNQYHECYLQEMEFREQLNYPPNGHLIVLHFRYKDINVLENYAWDFLEALKPYLHEGIHISDPMLSPIERIKNKYRFQIIFRGKKLKRFREVLRYYVLHSKHPKGMDVYVDVDAIYLM